MYSIGGLSIPYPSQTLQSNIKLKLEENLLSDLKNAIREHPRYNRLLELPENQPLIRSERRMNLENIYSPHCDGAVGPFSFREGSLNDLYEFFLQLLPIRRLIRNLHRKSLGMGYDGPDFYFNQNPRCFIAIEVENTTACDIKHLLGSIANCSFLGKIGIIAVFDEHLNYAGRLIQYLDFVKRKKKVANPMFRNVFIISKSRIEKLLGIN